MGNPHVVVVLDSSSHKDYWVFCSLGPKWARKEPCIPWGKCNRTLAKEILTNWDWAKLKEDGVV